MKKFYAMLLSAVMVFSLCACNTNAPSDTPTAPAGDNTAAPDTPSKEPVEPGADEPSMTLSLGTTSSAEDWQTLACQHFADLVSERTNGKITINVFPASQLGDANIEMESMISGSQDMFMEVELNYLYNYGIEELAVNTFGVVNTKEALWNLLNSDLMDEYRETFRQTNGIVTIAHNFIRQQATLCFKEELDSIEDFAGVKLRTVPSEAAVAAYGALGFKPTSVAFGEVYLSLAQNVIDGAAAALDAQYTMKFYEQAPYILNFGTDVSNVALWMNEAKFNQLSENQQQILLECGEECAEWYTKNAADAVAQYVTEMEAAGVKIIEPSDELVEECMARFKAAALQFEADGKMPAGSYDKIYAVAHPEG